MDTGRHPEEFDYIFGIMRQFDSGDSINWPAVESWQNITGIRLSFEEIFIIQSICDARSQVSQNRSS